MVVINNQELGILIKQEYAVNDIREIESLLKKRGTFDCPAMENGLFPAAILEKDGEYTGYTNVWVRDNIHIAHAHYMTGNNEAAVKNVNALMAYFKKYHERFEKIIDGEVDAENPMNRPHIRFDGYRLQEISEKWAHAQNDALGYFLWFYCRLANDGVILPSPEDIKVLALFVFYFRIIRFWEDEDSGHWEETRKISASSIGVVIAALKELRELINNKSFASKCKYHDRFVTNELLDTLINEGANVLDNILPAECVQKDPDKERRYDAALLFLIYPLNVVKHEIADQILDDVINNLRGEYGIRRYPGDSYWAPDYKKKLGKKIHTVDFSDDISSRNALLPEKGLEAQWCIFDPIVSVIFGKKFQKHLREEYVVKQIEYLNRSLGQITGENSDVTPFRCAELYYLREGNYVPNDHVPLLWAQANLTLALKEMTQSLLVKHSE